MRHRRMVMLVGLTGPLLALGFAYLLFLTVADPESPEGADIGYVHAEANVRPCPGTACPPTEVYQAGVQVTVVRTVSGESVRGNADWYEIRYGPETRFVHSSVMGRGRFAGGVVLDLMATVAALAVSAVSLLLIGWDRLRRAAAADPARFDGILFGTTAAIGIVVIAAGFVLHRLDGQPPVPFFADLLTNVGAGFATAAVTFVLFSSLLSHRAASREDVVAVATEVARLRDEIAGLRRTIDQRPAEPPRVGVRQWWRLFLAGGRGSMH